MEYYVLPEGLKAQLDGKMLALTVDKTENANDQINRIWGLNRALLANKIKGCQQEFEKIIQINGLGFKAAVSGSKVVFSLGYSHKIDFDLPKDVTLEVDKTGQSLRLVRLIKNYWD